jgi:hypothetical protein
LRADTNPRIEETRDGAHHQNPPPRRKDAMSKRHEWFISALLVVIAITSVAGLRPEQWRRQESAEQERLREAPAEPAAELRQGWDQREAVLREFATRLRGRPIRDPDDDPPARPWLPY